MNKKGLTIVTLVAITALVAGYLYWQSNNKSVEEKAEESLQKSVDTATSGTLPNLGTPKNPIQNLEGVNPATQGNPFSQTYENPFK